MEAEVPRMPLLPVHRRHRQLTPCWCFLPRLPARPQHPHPWHHRRAQARRQEVGRDEGYGVVGRADKVKRHGHAHNRLYLCPLLWLHPRDGFRQKRHPDQQRGESRCGARDKYDLVNVSLLANNRSPIQSKLVRNSRIHVRFHADRQTRVDRYLHTRSLHFNVQDLPDSEAWRDNLGIGRASLVHSRTYIHQFHVLRHLNAFTCLAHCLAGIHRGIHEQIFRQVTTIECRNWCDCQCSCYRAAPREGVCKHQQSIAEEEKTEQRSFVGVAAGHVLHVCSPSCKIIVADDSKKKSSCVVLRPKSWDVVTFR
mmetsp:Transcript_45161/g.92185  ORF Transcript_45161/g.92185 Transcript_45161/m.92185 type:complete len:310 (-) Transcript_45161:196-1125(-)